MFSHLTSRLLGERNILIPNLQISKQIFGNVKFLAGQVKRTNS